MCFGSSGRISRFMCYTGSRRTKSRFKSQRPVSMCSENVEQRLRQMKRKGHCRDATMLRDNQVGLIGPMTNSAGANSLALRKSSVARSPREFPPTAITPERTERYATRLACGARKSVTTGLRLWSRSFGPTSAASSRSNSAGRGALRRLRFPWNHALEIHHRRENVPEVSAAFRELHRDRFSSLLFRLDIHHAAFALFFRDAVDQQQFLPARHLRRQRQQAPVDIDAFCHRDVAERLIVARASVHAHRNRERQALAPSLLSHVRGSPLHPGRGRGM